MVPHSGDRVERGLDPVGGLVVVAAQLEADERRASVRRDLAGVRSVELRLDLGHVRGLCQGAFDVHDRRPEFRVSRGALTAALDQDLIGLIVAEPGVGDDPIRGARVAVAPVLVGDVLRCRPCCRPRG